MDRLFLGWYYFKQEDGRIKGREGFDQGEYLFAYRDGEKKARKRGRGGVVGKDAMELAEIRGQKL